MKYGSVCSGIEAATVAWHPLGWEPVFFSEIEPFPCAVLAHHYPHVPNHGDMTEFERWPDHAIDLLVGGTPCQSFSVAGLRKGLDDPRGNLMLTYLAIARRYRPRWLVWENVPGVLSSTSHDAPDQCPPDIDLDCDDRPEDGAEIVVTDEYETDETHAFACLLSGLSEIGYGFAYRTLDAQYARTQSFPAAVPQRRRRVFVVGYLGDWRAAAAVLFDAESLQGNSPPRRRSRQAVAGTLGARSDGGGGLGTDFELGGGLVPAVANPLTARMHKGVNTMGDEGQTMVASAAVAPTVTQNPYGDNECREGVLVGQVPQAVAFAENSRGEVRLAGGDGAVAPQLSTGGGKPGQGHAAIAENWRVRRLMPRECERLQAFPDDYTRVPGAGGGWRDVDPEEDLDELRALGLPLRLKGNRWRVSDPDGPRYKVLGNSMAVNVMQWLGERIALVDQLIRGAA